MLHNANLTLISNKVVLVPYRREHVVGYHSWMEDDELRAATASERLSLEEEYAMQQSWSTDSDKCTFIILDPAVPDTEGTSHHGGGAGMAGDVNLFFNDADDGATTAEIEVMIAEKGSRRRGLAGEALRMLMAYAATDLGVRKFRAKIGEANAASLALFQDKLNFTETSRSSIFQEVTLELGIEASTVGSLWHHEWQRGVYDENIQRTE